MKNYKSVLIIVLAATLVGCASQTTKAPVGIVDTARMLQYWPQFQNDNNQFSVDMAAIDSSKTPESQKSKERIQLQIKYARVQKDLTDQVRVATAQVAHDKNLQLVVTREFVGYGGTDITPDVEKVLKITEASPSASP
ncbi:MAG: hypothetical protein ABR584_06615 [Candidatus Baltobacteraceae bacterium]